ncbi:MAG TPA: SRPBCC family protein [Kineosporiaceae bacterium]|jgi:Polyketide cyclase / dehydrase and lipid transport|nr:SRPBCC family protein [Kineosporiaceae bacterium]
MADVTVTTDIHAGAEKVWAVLANPATWGDWVEIHQGFAGEAPAQFFPGGAFVQRVRVLGMPADVRWTIVGLQEPVRLELEGTGPMGINLRAEYGVEEHGDSSTVSGHMEFKGAAVMMVGSQLESEVGTSLRNSLTKLKARVEA